MTQDRDESGKFLPGNKAQQLRARVSRMGKISTARELFDYMESYLDEIEKSYGSRMPSILGFNNHCGMSAHFFLDLGKSTNVENPEEFKRAYTLCKEFIMAAQQEGAGAGVYKDGFVARIQGIGDKVTQEVREVKDGTILEVTKTPLEDRDG